MTARPDDRHHAPSLASRTRWLLRATPADHVLAWTVASASLPIVGKHLEPLGAMAAMGVWGFRHMPDFFTASAKSWMTPGNAQARKAERDKTNGVAQAALRGL